MKVIREVKAQEYYEKGKDLGEIINATSPYYNENLGGEQKKSRG